MSIVTYEKPLSHMSLADWYAKQWENQQTNSTRKNDACHLRHEAQLLRNETCLKAEWDTYINNVRLNDRISELEKWRDILQSLLDRFNQELANLKKAKFDTDKDIELLGTKLGVLSECISMRDCRLGDELTYDDADTGLKKELCLMENVKKQLYERSQAAWEKINKLEEVKFQLELDINDKSEAIDIDKEQLSFDNSTARITYKINPTRIPKQAVSYETWLERTTFMKQTADNELCDTLKLCESMFVVRERSKNDLIAQRDYVDFALRKRIFEIQKSRNETQWQQKTLREEMEKIGDELRTCKEGIMQTKSALKLAETRLENRTYRSGFDLALEEADQGLKNEVVQLIHAIQSLNNKMHCAIATTNALEDQLVEIDRDLENKSQALMTDIRCLDLRTRLKIEEPSTTINRNLKLTKMEDELPTT